MGLCQSGVCLGYPYEQACIHKRESVKEDMINVQVLPKELDEEVASYMVEARVMTKLTKDQAEYINVDEGGTLQT